MGQETMGRMTARRFPLRPGILPPPSASVASWRRFGLPVFLLILCVACTLRNPGGKIVPVAEGLQRPLPVGFAVQVGAFRQAENAVRLMAELAERGWEATYYRAPSGFYRVLFGDYATQDEAKRQAEILMTQGLVEAYVVIPPPDPAALGVRDRGAPSLRDEIVRTAQSFIGVPYLWGGTSIQDGFDCSGFTATVYRLNGLRIPRSSADQFVGGGGVQRERPGRGDLVFFAPGERGKVSHVGIYVGSDRFIHAPGRGKTIREEDLRRDAIRRTYLGARSYLSEEGS